MHYTILTKGIQKKVSKKGSKYLGYEPLGKLPDTSISGICCNGFKKAQSFYYGKKIYLDKVLMYILYDIEIFSTYVSTNESNIIYCINTSFAWRELSDIQYIIVVSVLG